MDNPEPDRDANMSNPEEEEDRHHQESESEFDDEVDPDNEEEEIAAMNSIRMRERADPNTEEILATIRRQQEIQERKHLEREFLAQNELLLKREPADLMTPQSTAGYVPVQPHTGIASPNSPPPGTQQYLYAATPSGFISSSIAAVQAVAAGVALQGRHSLSVGSSSAGSSTPTGNGTSLSPNSSRGQDQDQSKYTFEEQFKQKQIPITEEVKAKGSIKNLECAAQKLYELSEDPKRKQFLDDLFNYMQKRGTPVNRIPIMAKHVLDLYELYRLVVARGGLVEVINKKIWREITKGLNLPSSITSAAFTLRTQYMKYLYAYECDREKLSTADELQAAIDGNRREGRRSSYGPYADIVAVSRNSHHPPSLSTHTSPLSLVARTMNGHGSNQGLASSRQSSPLPLGFFPNAHHLPLNLAAQENGLYGSHNFSSGDNCNSVPSTPSPLAVPQQEALNLEVPRNTDHKPLDMASSRKSNVSSKNNNNQGDLISAPKRNRCEDEKLFAQSGMPSAHIKISSSRGPDGRTQIDGSLMVSMEVNGIMYQGVLFAAQNHHRSRVS